MMIPLKFHVLRKRLIYATVLSVAALWAAHLVTAPRCAQTPRPAPDGSRHSARLRLAVAVGQPLRPPLVGGQCPSPHAPGPPPESQARRRVARIGGAVPSSSCESRADFGGEAARAAIAVALATAPKLLLADEPTGEVDAENEARILDLLAT